MHVGYSVTFQNPVDGRPDGEVYADELRLLQLAIDLGFDSVWTVEHHFTDYTMCPDPVQLLSWLALRTEHVRLGTSVIVLPWHEPVRFAEQIVLLDNLSGGRLMLGIGRGSAASSTTASVSHGHVAERFVASTEMILAALETGIIEADNELLRIPGARSGRGPTIRCAAGCMPRRCRPTRCRSLLGSVSASSSSRRSRGRSSSRTSRRTATCGTTSTGSPAGAPGQRRHRRRRSPPCRGTRASLHRGLLPDRAAHYEFELAPHAGVKGYEFYTDITRYIDKHGSDQAIDDFVTLMPWGTPDQAIEKVAFIRDKVGIAGFTPNFSFAGMPAEDAERSVRLFATEVLPELRTWDAEPVGMAAVAAKT